MSRTRQSILIAAIAFSLQTSIAFASPTAVEILKKTQSIMEKAKTYQAVMLVNTDAGKMGKMTLRLDMKTSGKKSSFLTSPVGQATGQFAMMGAAASSSQIVDDGKNMWVYTPMLKSYAKRPTMGGKGIASPFKDIGGMTKEADIKLSGTENVGGRPAYVIQVNPKKAPKGGQTVTFYIDQATYRMKQMKMNSQAPSMSGGAQPVQVTVQVQSEKIDEPIADSAFRFVPPAGAKEMQGGFPGAMGGGMGRGR